MSWTKLNDQYFRLNLTLTNLGYNQNTNKGVAWYSEAINTRI